MNIKTENDKFWEEFRQSEIKQTCSACNHLSTFHWMYENKECLVINCTCEGFTNKSHVEEQNVEIVNK